MTACREGSHYARSDGLDCFTHVGCGGDDSRDDRFDRTIGSRGALALDFFEAFPVFSFWS
jgi:hypothetical protein